jgi:hypothetical protein
LDGQGLWIHVNGRYECRNQAGGPLRTGAEPVGWPTNTAELPAPYQPAVARQDSGR